MSIAITENTLIAEIIKLFAKMAWADGVVTEEEKQYVKKYFISLYPTEFAKTVYKEFEIAINEKIETNLLLSSINERLNNDDKVFLIVKLIELMSADSVDDSEKELLFYIAKKFDISNDSTNFLLDIFTGNETKFDAKDNFRFIEISDSKKTSDIYIDFTDLKLIIIDIGKTLVLIQKDLSNSIKINDKPVIKQFAIKIPMDAQITINDRYNILSQDLKYYFKNLDNTKNICFLSESNNDLEFCLEKTKATKIICEKVKSKIFLMPVNGDSLYVNGIQTNKKINVNFDDKIFYDNIGINLRFILFQIGENTIIKHAKKNKITIGNHIESSIYIEDDFDKAWDSTIEIKGGYYFLEIKDCPYNIFVENKVITRNTKVNFNDKIRIRNAIISYNTNKKVFEKKDFGIKNLDAQNLKYYFSDGTIAIDGISFRAKKGELIGLMGASGSGKSTLLNLLNGFYKPKAGEILADGINIHENINLFNSNLSYVPQDDLLFENLTVYENLYYNAKLRFPGVKRSIEKLVNRVLIDIGLYEKRNIKVGDPLNKTLSGGERKRVNIGLELLADSNIILLDEPTSGLSSKDSERILKILQNLSFQGKIIIVVIHQPSIRLYDIFNKIMILDKGGKLAFFGSTFAALKYFNRYSDKTVLGDAEKATPSDPDTILDTIEQQINDIDGTPLPIRKHSPDFWKAEFEKNNKAFQSIEADENTGSISKQSKKTFKDHFIIFKTLLKRNFKNKLRDKSNLIITFLFPPLLGLFVGGILHYVRGDNYNFFENDHIATFLFLSMLIAVFLGMTNSIEEIIKDQNILQREKMLNISNISYFNSKIITLIPFAIIQNILFVFVGYFILDGKEFYLIYVLILTLVSLSGISLGLFISSIPKLTTKAAVNIIPIILIPQIVFGGSMLLEYDKMNKQLIVNKNSPVPEICQVMPSRWGYEALVTYQGYNNSYVAIESLESARDSLTYKITIIEDELILDQLIQERDSIRIKIEAFKDQYHDSYGNHGIAALIKIDGNIGYKNFKHGKTSIYPMFIKEKKLPIINKTVSTTIYNSFVLLFISLFINLLTIVILKLRYK